MNSHYIVRTLFLIVSSLITSCEDISQKTNGNSLLKVANPVQNNYTMALDYETDITLNQSLKPYWRQGQNFKEFNNLLKNNGFQQTEEYMDDLDIDNKREFYRYEKIIKSPFLENRVQINVWLNNGKLEMVKGVRFLTGL